MAALTKERKAAETESFRRAEFIREVLEDLIRIDKLIPRESSRYGCLIKDENARAVIEGRKNELLLYIQMICRDRIYWGNRILEGK